MSKTAKENWIRVGMSTCGISAGADKVFHVLKEETVKRGIDVRIERCGCAGKCYAEPLVEVSIEGMPQVVYGDVDTKTALKILDKHVLGKRFINDHIYDVKVT
ncbi:MAG: (2Fe-2S) ferredoxin domain-containing protein [Candidatus Omnitrophota bacterium]